MRPREEEAASERGGDDAGGDGKRPAPPIRQPEEVSQEIADQEVVIH